MWLLRGVARSRWQDRRADDPSHIAAAAKDLGLRPGEDGLSLFWVDDEEEGRRVATLLGVHKRRVSGRSDHLDYILVPPDALDQLGLIVILAPDPALGPELSERHREAKGITPDLSLRLAAILLDEGRFRLGRIRRQEVDAAATGASAPHE